jgi:plasmid replication initiation protein
MTVAARRRAVSRAVRLDRSLEALPLFRLSDSADDGVITYADGAGGRWRVIPSPGDRLPGTFDQDVYVELLRRYQEAGEPADGAITFTLHAFLRAMGRRVDGRTYEQLRGALGRLERTTLESTGIYEAAATGRQDLRFTLLASVAVERRRSLDREQLQLFSTITLPPRRGRSR